MPAASRQNDQARADRERKCGVELAGGVEGEGAHGAVEALQSALFSCQGTRRGQQPARDRHSGEDARDDALCGLLAAPGATGVGLEMQGGGWFEAERGSGRLAATAHFASNTSGECAQKCALTLPDTYHPATNANQQRVRKVAQNR